MIICGDCLEAMRGMESNSVDTVITDPPYGLKFMGKKWDSFRSTKQTKSQVVKNLGAGMRQTTLKENILFQEWTTEWAVECLRVAKPGATLLCFGGSRTYHRMACAIEDAGWIIKDCIMWLYGSGFPKALDISKQMDKRAGAEREVVGTKISRQPTGNTYAQDKWTKDHSMPHEMDITEPATEEAKQWDGWKSHGLKPAYEPIIVAMKPNDKTYVNNALKYGVSGLNIDECRIGTEPIIIKRHDEYKECYKGYSGETSDVKSKGRFPANVILDEEAGKILDEQSGIIKSPAKGTRKAGEEFFGKSKSSKSVDWKKPEYGDKGGASRFFYTAKASKSEKNAGCGDLPRKQKIFSSTDIKDVEKRFTTQPVSNNHPTVKPLKLMEYLCKLTKIPTGGIVLDPFCGSGSTGIAAINTGREFIGIEMDKEYCKIAEARIKHYEKD